jgi:hypothetical protein
MDVLKKKNNEMINNNVLEVIKEFALKGEFRLLGSNSLRAIHYASDYDVATNLTRSPEVLAKQFRILFANAYKNKDIWITDFKCGWDDRLVYEGDGSLDSVRAYLENPLVPKKIREKILTCTDKEERITLIKPLYILRWTRADMKAGKVQLIDGTYKRLEDCIMDKTTLKIDMIARVGERFIELSENYYVTYRGEPNFDKALSSKEVIMKSLEKQIDEYSEKDKLKSLKRMFSLLRMEKTRENEKNLDDIAEKLVDFFNSETGFMGKIKNEISILELLMEQTFRPVEWEVIYDNLQLIKEEISNIYKIKLADNFFEMINKMTPRTAEKHLQVIKSYFMEKINESSARFIEETL